MTDPILPLSPAAGCLIGLAILLLSLALPMPPTSCDSTPRPSVFAAVRQNLTNTIAAHHIHDIAQTTLSALAANLPATTQSVPPENRTIPLKVASHLLRILVPGAETQLFITLGQQLLKFSQLSLPCGIPTTSTNGPAPTDNLSAVTPESDAGKRRRRRLPWAVQFMPEVPRRTSSLGWVGAVRLGDVRTGVEGGRFCGRGFDLDSRSPNTLQALLKDEYLAGLWKGDLLVSLLWGESPVFKPEEPSSGRTGEPTCYRRVGMLDLKYLEVFWYEHDGMTDMAAGLLNAAAHGEI
ncbi:hypothetical protein B0H67DRAFT_656279 [Lasiosphaeris hirsuta]|uniref:Uncharacterized protein n=1 Tax=Lasiosphaeris hirsuta TaxID=260670 RepID=A0AA40E163_9PEZI|nr:hypothetical protein B0H67DRAFT_656279 [Lasiosphaeris hirsuta]